MSDHLSAIEAIIDILTRPDDDQNSMVVPLEQSRHVISIHSSNYASLKDFKSHYMSLKRPVLCFVDLDQLSEVTSWIRDTDDIALAGDSVELTQWRFDRIEKSFAKQLDPLTKVFQRSRLIETLEEVCPTASSESPVSLILIDIDHLKAINDQHGPVEGNHVLQEFGGLIQSLCRMTLVARTRGGEFAVLVESRESEARRIAEILLNAIQQFHWCRLDGVTASLGVASVNESCQPSILLTRADEALYAAKASGRNRVTAYSEVAAKSHLTGEDLQVISLENKARVMSERVTSFVTHQSKLIMQNLRREANTDALTELFNRRYLDRKLGEEFLTAKRLGKDLSIALVDVDHFGEVNKQHGWPTGDHVLREIAQVILSCIRGSDWVGRYGGEELCIVMPGTILKNATSVCERIRKTIESTRFKNSNDEVLRVTLSVGVVQYQLESDPDMQQLLQRVSEKTLEAKRSGRNLVAS
ncbi:MAG: GGDEF domain-containing protein [Planctomycetota bacterium]